jgi:uncharacterized membrane-anchored protein YhcB (DUF1043 family)
MTPEVIGLLVAVVIAAITIVLLIQKGKAKKQTENELNQARTDLDGFKAQYKDIIDVDREVSKRKAELSDLNQQVDTLTSDFKKQKEQLNTDFQTKRSIYENLLSEISILEESLENISYGMYKPHYDFQSTEEYKNKLDQIREKQKQVIKDERATYCSTTWTVSGSEVKGRKMVKEASKLMLRAFNGECDACVAKVNWGNIANMEARMQKAFEAINKLGSTNQIEITNDFLKLKLEELYLEFELEEKKYKEKEEQRRIREQMREEEKALKEMERAQREAEAEEERYQKALDKAKAEVEKAKGDEVDKLNEKIKQLEENLQKAHDQKERAISQAQLTKSGHVYIISNIGSFGDDVFKVGMTRRLEPIDRVNELGDASVPFDFDVHGMIYSENAPELENTLHKRLDATRINLVNYRAEFFRTSLDEIEGIVKSLGLTVEFTKLAEAKEYRSTLSIREAKLKETNSQTEKPKTEIEKQLDKFPTSLD